LDRPKKKGEFYVFPLKDIPGVDGKSQIMIKGDMRWVMEKYKEETYLARVFQSNAILVKKPAWDYSMLHDREETIKSPTT
jgi:hypothetical protein